MYLGLMDINKVLNISTRLQFIGIKRGEIKGSFVKVTRTSNTLSIPFQIIDVSFGRRVQHMPTPLVHQT